ncbi:MAG TPA: hypothetical protein VGZ71_16360 [Puia sp.]|jgi:hypothetical protein|nr:hypothetical protein [Puia sp.]
MKTLITLSLLVLIIGSFILSCVVYLKDEYATSALLTVTWLVGIAYFINSRNFSEQKKAGLNK